MPEISLFMSEDDLKKIVEGLIESGCTLFPDAATNRPEAHEVNSLESFQQWREGKGVRFFFVVSSEWKVAPFEWGKIEKNGNVEFYIRQRTGGPTIDIFAPFSFEDANSQVVLPHGFIAYHSTFWNPLKSRKERPPEALRNTYAGILRRLKIDSCELRGQHRKYLIAKDAKAKLDAGCVLGPPFNISEAREF